MGEETAGFMWSFSYPIEDKYYDCPLPRITIPRVERVELPDLPIGGREFPELAEIPYLVNYMDGTRSPDRARFWLGYDSEAFTIIGRLLGFNHGREDVAEDQLEHDQLHLAINPTPKRLRGFRIRLGPERVISIDSGGEEAPENWWGDGGEIRLEIEEDGWSFAIRIPFSLLGVDPPERGQIWRMNLFRVLSKRQEDNSSWSVMYLGRIDIPERYGEVVFGGEGVCGGIKSEEVVPGKSRAIWWASGGPGRMTLEVWRGNDQIVGRAVDIGPGRNFPEISFDMSDGGGVVLNLIDEENRYVAVWPVVTGCEVLGPRIGKLHREAISLMESECSRVVEGGWKIMEGTKSMRYRASSPDRSADSWKELEAVQRELELDASILRIRSGISNPDRPAAILATHNLVKLISELPLPDVFSEEGFLSAAGRCSDSIQIVVFAFDEDLDDCRIDIGPLKDPGGGEIPRDSIELWRVGNVFTRRPRYLVEHVGAHPDPLLPVSNFSVPSGGFEVFWLTVSVPEGTPPGSYRGSARVESRTGELEIPISLKVWGFDLPKRSTLRTAFPMFEGEIEKFYGEPLTDERRWLYYDFLLKRRISPSCQYERDPRPRVEDVGRAIAGGTNVISMGYMEYDDLDEYLERVEPVVTFLRSRGWLKWAYAYGFDEVVPSGYPEIEEAYGKLKDTYQELPRGCTIGPEHDLPRLFGTVDIWIPQTDRFEAVYRDRQSRGDELWWYVSMWPRHPFANMFVDYPAIDHRILFWQSWKYGISGFLYYCIDLWSSNYTGRPSLEREVAALPDASHREAIEAGARWPDVPWNTYTGPTGTNGDGQLIYPGPGGGPLSSVRLECIRHGIEDYELFAKLESELESARNRGVTGPILEECESILGVPPEVCRDLTNYTHDPCLLLDARERLGELIERLSRTKGS